MEVAAACKCSWVCLLASPKSMRHSRLLRCWRIAKISLHLIDPTPPLPHASMKQQRHRFPIVSVRDTHRANQYTLGFPPREEGGDALLRAEHRAFPAAL